MAAQTAAANNIVIRKVMHVVPHYMRWSEGDDAFARYKDWFLGILRTVWGPEVDYDFVVEGQVVGTSAVGGWLQEQRPLQTGIN